MALLGLLKEQDMHGYELKKRLSDAFGFASAVSFGSLYPALARLEAAGAVQAARSEGEEPAQDGRPGPGRRANRRRKVYGITTRGAEMFEELLAGSQSAGEDERSFNVRLAFARHLPREARLGLLEQRRAVLGQRLAQLAGRARARRDDRYMRILADRQEEALSRDVSWLDSLIQEERSGVAAAQTAGSPLTPSRKGGGPADLPAARLVPLASTSQLHRAARDAPAPAATEGNPRPMKDGT
jgi:DNA-binding PadR family transcriptional regulator